MKRIWFIIILITNAVLSVAQNTNCQSFLNSIEKMYRAGNYLTIIETNEQLEGCHFSKEQSSTIYKYLIPTYKKIGKDSLAYFYAKKFIKLNPFYEYNPQTDPKELQIFLLKYYAFPKFTLGYSGGLNAVFVDKINVYSLLDTINYDVPYSSHLGITTFGFLEFNWTKNFASGLSLGLVSYNYMRVITAYERYQIHYIEKASAYTLSQYFKYKLAFLSIKNFTPYIKLGGYISYTPKFYSEVDLLETDPTNPETSLRYENYQFLPEGSRLNFRYGVTSSFGISYKIQGIDLFIESYWQRDLIDYIPSQGRYVPELMDNFFYVSDDFYLNKLIVTAGISFNFKYVVKKKF